MQTFTQTKLRREILAILQKADKPMKAYNILAQLRNTRPNAQPPTVYRVLNFLKEKHAIHEIAHHHTYILCQQTQEEHRIAMLLICEQCHNVTEIPASAITNILHLPTFQLKTTTIELLGLCQQCQ